MPRIYLNEQQKLNNRLASWVYGEMKTQNITQRQLAEERGITQPAISHKLKCRSFDFEDICCFVRVFKPEGKEIKRLLGGEYE